MRYRRFEPSVACTFSSGRALRHAILAVAALAAAGCHSAAKRDKAQFDQAQTRANEALRCVAQLNLRCASDAIGEALSLADDVRLRHRRHLEDQELPPGPIYLGSSVQAWQQRWKDELKDAIVTHFDALADASRQGQLDWAESRSIIDTYGGKEFDERWLAIYQGTEVARGQRNAGAIVFVCWCPEYEALCPALQAMFATKLPQPLVEGLHMSSAARAGAYAVLELRAAASAYQDYAVTGARDAERNGQVVFALPTGLRLDVTLTSHHGKTTWDGTNALSVTAPLPTVVGAYSQGEATSRQWEALRQKVAEKLAATAAPKAVE